MAFLFSGIRTLSILFSLLTVLEIGQMMGNPVNNEEDQRKIVVLLGAPGSGKGTQAQVIKEALQIPHISTGDLFRENMAQGTPLGKIAKEAIEQGKLVSDSLVLEMLFNRISEKDASKGFLLDGFPRTLPQAKAFQERLRKGDHLTVIELRVSDATVLKRILGRAANSTVKRTDDTPEIIARRLEVYHKETTPLSEYYQTEGVLHTINGELAPAEISKQIKSLLSK